MQLLIWLQKRLIRAGYNIRRVSLGKWCVTMVRGRLHNKRWVQKEDELGKEPLGQRRVESRTRTSVEGQRLRLQSTGCGFGAELFEEWLGKQLSPTGVASGSCNGILLTLLSSDSTACWGGLALSHEPLVILNVLVATGKTKYIKRNRQRKCFYLAQFIILGN